VGPVRYRVQTTSRESTRSGELEANEMDPIRDRATMMIVRVPAQGVTPGALHRRGPYRHLLSSRIRDGASAAGRCAGAERSPGWAGGVAARQSDSATSALLIWSEQITGTASPRRDRGPKGLNRTIPNQGGCQDA